MKLKGLRKYLNEIAKWLRERAFQWLPDLIERARDAEALSMIVAAREAVMRGEATTVSAGESAAFSQIGELFTGLRTDDPAPQGRTIGVAKGTESAPPADQEAGLVRRIVQVPAAR